MGNRRLKLATLLAAVVLATLTLCAQGKATTTSSNTHEYAPCTGDVNEPVVNFIVCVRNRARFLTRLLLSMERMRTQARMCNWRVIVMDQGSDDADVYELVRAWGERVGIPAITLPVKTTGEGMAGFLRAGSLRQGFEWVYEHFPDDIVFTTDVDMIVPPNFLTVTRHFCVRGKEVFFPICFSLFQDRGLLNSAEHGFWRHFGYGMCGMYVADAIEYGVYAVDATKNSHGMEDNHAFWLLQECKLKTNRPMVQGFYHVWHRRSKWGTSKDGVSGNETVKDPIVAPKV